MTRIFEDPARFTDDAVAGFVRLHSRYVERVRGGVVRVNLPAEKVAVVVGGGSGHYPAFFGVVGPGFATGAVVGNVFTSPSAADARSVAEAADTGAGVLLITGNYAGDVMNFTRATEALVADGIDARFMVVTDDIASAPADQTQLRRGIAGDFVVFKLAAAAAEAGLDLDGVLGVAHRANDRTRTLGVAFGGCTLPGAADPLFTVNKGSMALGLGIHGEPGIQDLDLPSASSLAAVLVDGILADRPAAEGSRVAVILNGLGGTKYEELFVLWDKIAPLLESAGLEPVEPEVGELVTSLDMAGCSLTVTWLDEELEGYWRSPVDTPAFRKGLYAGAPAGRPAGERATRRAERQEAAEPALDEAGKACAARAVRALERMAEVVAAHEEELGRLDAVAGDGDHGRGMAKGTTSAVAAARRLHEEGHSTGAILRAAGAEWAAAAGGTSGALWGEMLDTFGSRLATAYEAADLADALRGAYDAAVALGGAAPGDKTMLDAFLPFCEEFARQVGDGADLRSAWTAASSTADRAAQDTAALRPRVGRARPLAERSVGHPDPGAVSFALCVGAVAEVF